MCAKVTYLHLLHFGFCTVWWNNQYCTFMKANMLNINRHSLRQVRTHFFPLMPRSWKNQTGFSLSKQFERNCLLIQKATDVFGLKSILFALYEFTCSMPEVVLGMDHVWPGMVCTRCGSNHDKTRTWAALCCIAFKWTLLSMDVCYTGADTHCTALDINKCRLADNASDFFFVC